MEPVQLGYVNIQWRPRVRYVNFGFHKSRENSWPSEWLSEFQEGIYLYQWFSLFSILRLRGNVIKKRTPITVKTKSFLNKYIYAIMYNLLSHESLMKTLFTTSTMPSVVDINFFF
jgi:hypothetical protein